MGHEERGDRDRDHVVEHLAPGGEERPELVERVAREARGPAGLGIHRGGLGVCGGGQVEDPAGDDEHDRRQAERERGDQTERVIDRRADVAVRRREQGVYAQDPLEPGCMPLSHGLRGARMWVVCADLWCAYSSPLGAVACSCSLACPASSVASESGRLSAGGAVRITRQGALLTTYFVIGPT